MPERNGKRDTQRTEQGIEIPVPKRRDVLRDLRKIAKADTREDGDSAASGPEQEQGE